MDTAIKAWDWVNQDEKDFFFLLTHHHHNGCGAEEERTPYKVTAVRYNQADFTATLKKEAVTWDETLRSFQLTIGTTAHPAVLRRKRSARSKRDIDDSRKAIINFLCKDDRHLPLIFRSQCTGLKTVDKALDFALGDGKIQAIVDAGAQLAINTIANKLDPTFEGESGTASFSLGKDDPNDKQSMTILNKGAVDVKVAATCTGCFVSGNIDYKVFASRVDGGKVDLYIDITPNVKGRIALELIGTVTKELEFNLLATFLNAKLKALAVGNVISLAPSVANGPGVYMKGEMAANVSLGFEFNTANASVALSLGSDTQLIHRDWDVATASPSAKFNSVKLEGQINPYWRFGIGFGVDIIGKAQVGAFAGFTAQMNNVFKPGSCNGPTGSGILQQTSNFKVDLGYKVLAEASTGIGLVDGTLYQLIPQPKDGKSLIDHPLEVFCRPESS
ncbi:hypothetical protein ABW21_db0208294 [Orbilia brochopaga]|nr:hypothetical protein ABW21_db0208294 [Drechslerella brochopaga]